MAMPKDSLMDAPPTQYPPQFAEPQPYPQAPPSYDALYSVKAPDTQALQFVRVVQQQPQHIMMVTRPPGHEPNSFFIYSIICVGFSAVFGWPCLACTIPALILSFMSKDHAARGDFEAARSYGRVALGLNTAALLAFVLFFAFVVTVSVEE